MKTATSLTIAVFAQALAAPAGAAPGDIDTSFGGGVILRAVGPYVDYGSACALQPDAKLLVGGRTHVDPNFNDSNFAVIRHSAVDGTPDTAGFGPGTGSVITPVMPYSDMIQGLAL